MIPSPTTEEVQKVRSLAGNRATSMRRRKLDAPAKAPIDFDALACLEERQVVELTEQLRAARNAGDKMRSGYGKITKTLQLLWDACVACYGGEVDKMADVSLSDALLMVYKRPEVVDATFGDGTYKETRTSTNGGASTWRKPWSLLRKRHCGSGTVQKTPLERLTDNIRTASGDVPYVKALATLNRIYGKG